MLTYEQIHVIFWLLCVRRVIGKRGKKISAISRLILFIYLIYCDIYLHSPSLYFIVFYFYLTAFIYVICVFKHEGNNLKPLAEFSLLFLFIFVAARPHSLYKFYFCALFSVAQLRVISLRSADTMSARSLERIDLTAQFELYWGKCELSFAQIY